MRYESQPLWNSHHNFWFVGHYTTLSRPELT